MDYPPDIRFDLVVAMHKKFGLAHEGPPRKLDADERNFRIMALHEELDEYAQAETLVEEYDALLDLLVFTLGTLYRQGLPAGPGFEEVMHRNLQKEVGQNGDKRGGFKKDLVKPDGWVGPEKRLVEILEWSRRKGEKGWK